MILTGKESGTPEEIVNCNQGSIRNSSMLLRAVKSWVLMGIDGKAAGTDGKNLEFKIYRSAPSYCCGFEHMAYCVSFLLLP